MGTCVQRGLPAIVLEYLPGSLHDLLHKPTTGKHKLRPLGERVQVQIAREIATGVAYLHSEQLIHRDIKARARPPLVASFALALILTPTPPLPLPLRPHPNQPPSSTPTPPPTLTPIPTLTPTPTPHPNPSPQPLTLTPHPNPSP
jgi:hypothetical protein